MKKHITSLHSFFIFAIIFWFSINCHAIPEKTNITEKSPGYSSQTAPWIIVHGNKETESVMHNIGKLADELSRIATKPVRAIPLGELDNEIKQNYNLILTGEYDKNNLAREILDKYNRSNPFSSDAKFVQEQGYIVDIYPGELNPNRKIIVAVGWNSSGAIYAVSHLRTRILSSQGALYLDTEESPVTWHQFQITERPDLEERAIYYYIAYGYDYPPLTPASWDEAAWEHWVDKAVCAQFTHIYFCLWGGTEYYFPGSPACYNEKNRITHERLKHLIQYAHIRGLKVTCLLSPTFIPTDIIDSNTARLHGLRAGGYYGDHLKTICQAEPGIIVMGDKSWKGSMALITEVMNSELDWFKDADSFQIWFYDPGGCYCGPERYNCKGLQDLRLYEQVTSMTRLIWSRNPKANIDVHLWPMWLLQTSEYIGWGYREPFLNRIKDYFSSMDKMNRITVCDLLGWPGDPPKGLIPAKEKGFRTNGFIYSTGFENGYCFVNPGFTLFAWEAAMAKETRIQAAYIYRYEEGSKYPQTFIGSRYLWNLDIQPMNALRQYTNWIANSNSKSAEKLYKTFILIDSFTCEGTEGQDHESKGAEIQLLVEQALAELPDWKQNELEWLLTTARSFAILGKAVEYKNDKKTMDSLALELKKVTTNSPSFKEFSTRLMDPMGTHETRFIQYVNWLSTGWYKGPF